MTGWYDCSRPKWALPHLQGGRIPIVRFKLGCEMGQFTPLEQAALHAIFKERRN